MKVGDIIWYRDDNLRVWLDRERKRPERDFWVTRKILGETRVSWIIGRPGAKLYEWDNVKIKKSLFAAIKRPHGWAVTEQEVSQRVYVAEHGGYKLGERVHRCDDYRTIIDICAALERWETGR